LTKVLVNDWAKEMAKDVELAEKGIATMAGTINPQDAANSIITVLNSGMTSQTRRTRYLVWRRDNARHGQRLLAGTARAVPRQGQRRRRADLNRGDQLARSTRDQLYLD
jgi:hypothetical protein